MKLRFQVARSREDVLRCQYLIAETYHREYGVVFSVDGYNLEGKIEPWPHHYLMALDGTTLAAAMGLYLRDTYVERFGRVTDAELDALIAAAGAAGQYRGASKREVTKLVVHRDYRGHGLSHFLLGTAHSNDFLCIDAEEPPVLVYCAKRSITANVYGKTGIRSRHVKPFPIYQIHARYASEADPMDSRLIIPDFDVPAHWRALRLPGDYDIGENKE
jgi:GNAT superfamily N-acetyltransferase